jgi:hypothetical protein
MYLCIPSGTFKLSGQEERFKVFENRIFQHGGAFLRIWMQDFCPKEMK